MYACSLQAASLRAGDQVLGPNGRVEVVPVQLYMGAAPASLHAGHMLSKRGLVRRHTCPTGMPKNIDDRTIANLLDQPGGLATTVVGDELMA